MEIWKQINGFNGIYEISNFGRIKSIRRLVNNSSKSKRVVGGLFLKPTVCKAGYKKVELCDKQNRITAKVHRLVASHHIPNPNNYNVINHIDGDKLNNNHTNLEWCTYRHNSNHYFNGNSRSNYKGVCFNSAAGKWGARCSFNGKRHFLGYYNDEGEAGNAYIDFCNDNNIDY